MNRPEPVAELAPLALDPDGPRVVAIGGGHGLAQALGAIQSYAGSIDAVVTVADDGGSSGRISPAMGIPPPGDLRKALLALSPEPSIWGELVGYRFDRADVEGHSLGNLMLAALTDLTGEFTTALDLFGSLLGSLGRVHPVALGSLQLEATVDGRSVAGQVAVARSRGHIDRLTVGPASVPTNPRGLHAIRAADQIVLAPGSLYTSLLSTLVVQGVCSAIGRSLGQLVFVMNLITQDGETLGMTGRDHVDALLDLADLDRSGTIVAHAGSVVAPPQLQAVDLVEDDYRGWDVHHADVADAAADWPQHDPLKLGTELRRLLR